MAESVCVGVRVRPFNDREKGLNAELCIDMDGPTTRIRDANGKETPFTFDESFWSHDGMIDDGTGYNIPAPGSKYADQRYVFDTFGQRVLNNAWEGFHCCLFAYGQTGAGKSYSMVGYGKNKGIVPISCEEIFIRIANNTNPDKSYEVTVSMIEIYNETVQDLIIEPEQRPKKGLEIRESKLLGIYIDGVTKRPVADYPSIEAFIDEATSHRTVGSTLMNATSSRAHTVQTIEFKQVENMGGKPQVKISMVNLVDLAGSEKAGQTGATGDRLKEGAAINKSLSSLGNVIEKLAEKSTGKKNVLIPYRDSKLTRLLQNALGGSSKTIMICALSPASSNYEETLSTLRYADRAKKIKNTAVINENPQDKIIRQLKEENAKLKEMMESLAAGGPVDSGQVQEMQNKQKEIEEVENALAEMEKSFEQRVQEAKEREMEQKMKRRTTVAALMRSTTPQFVNLNEDPQLTCRIKYNLDEGKVTHIGSHKEDSETESSSQSESSETDEDEADEAKEDVKAELDSMSMEELKEKAQEVGAPSDKIESAEGAEDPMNALVELVMECTPKKEPIAKGSKASAKENKSSDSESSDDDQEEEPDILLLSETIYHKHAFVTNRDNHCYLMSIGEPAEATWINGVTVAELLQQQMAKQEADAEKAKQEAESGELKTGSSEVEEAESKGEVAQEAYVPKESEGDAHEADAKEEGEGDAAAAGHDKVEDADAKVEEDRGDAAAAEDKKADGGEDNGEEDKVKPEEHPSQNHVHHHHHRDETILSAKEPEGILLRHGDRVVFGRCYFFFCIPTEGVAEMMIMSGQVDYQTAATEMSRNAKKKGTAKSPTAFQFPGNAMMGASKWNRIRAHTWQHKDRRRPSRVSADTDTDHDEGAVPENVFHLLGEKDKMLEDMQAQLAAARLQLADKDATIYELQRQLHIALGGDGSAPGAPELPWPGPGRGLPQQLTEALSCRGSLRPSVVSFTDTGNLTAPPDALLQGHSALQVPAGTLCRSQLSPRGPQLSPTGLQPSPRGSQMAEMRSAGAEAPSQRLSQLPSAAVQSSMEHRAHGHVEDQSLPSLLGSASRGLEVEDAEMGQVLSTAGREAPRTSYKASGVTHQIQKTFADAINVIDVVEATLVNLKERKKSARRSAGKAAKASS